MCPPSSSGSPSPTPSTLAGSPVLCASRVWVGVVMTRSASVHCGWMSGSPCIAVNVESECCRGNREDVVKTSFLQYVLWIQQLTSVTARSWRLCYSACLCVWLWRRLYKAEGWVNVLTTRPWSCAGSCCPLLDAHWFGTGEGDIIIIICCHKLEPTLNISHCLNINMSNMHSAKDLHWIAVDPCTNDLHFY